MQNDKFSAFLEGATGIAIAPSEDTTHQSPVAPAGRLLGALERHTSDDGKELLKYRFLCRGGGILLVGPTGVGKSTFSMQATMLWSIGKPFMGITPARPLKSLLIQAENDDGDLAEMRDSVLASLHLSEEQRRDVLKNVIVAREDSRTAEGFIMYTVRPLVQEHRPDLLWIDPALSYLGGEASSQKDVGSFLRNLLNPVLHEFDCGCIVIHHTNKPAKGKEKADWQAGDLAYLGSGSAEWANWARGILAIQSVGKHDVFRLVNGKRYRLGWTEADGVTKAYSKLIRHSREDGCLFWEEATESDLPQPATCKVEVTVDSVMAHVFPDKPITKAMLQLKVQASGCAVSKAKALIGGALDEKLIHEWHKPRNNARPEIWIAREPMPELWWEGGYARG